MREGLALLERQFLFYQIIMKEFLEIELFLSLWGQDGRNVHGEDRTNVKNTDVIVRLYIYQIKVEEDDQRPPARDDIPGRCEPCVHQARDHGTVDTGPVSG